jgi:Tol biopolymer transport system component
MHPKKEIPMGNTRKQVALAAAAIGCFLAGAIPAHATFPGLNGRIAFQAQVSPDAHIQIYTVRPNGKALRQITAFTDADAVNPDWSPDGRLILFEIDRDHPPFCSIALMNPDGSSIVELTPADFVCENNPHFTPDGSGIIFDRFDGVDEAFWTMDVAGNNRQRLGQCCSDPVPSPNGEKFSYVAFQDESNFLTALYTAKIDGSNPRALTPFEFGVAVKQDWSPDGRHLLFTKNGIGHPPGISANIAVIRPDGTGLRLLTHYEGGDVQAIVGSYSPDGHWIVFRLEDHGSFGLYKMRSDGSHMQVILPLSDFKPRLIAWGPRPSDEDDDDEDQ